MNELTDLGNSISIIGGADGPTAIFLAGKLNMGIMVATIVIGLLICFFGLKLVKIVSAVLGFLIGASAGAGVAATLGIDDIALVVIAVVCAVGLAVLSYLIYRVGVFIMTFLYSLGMFLTLFGMSSMAMLIIAAVVSLILAILAAVFVEPVIIIITAVCGGMSAGPAIIRLAAFTVPSWAGYAVGAVLAILGMIVQFALHSRKIGKKEKVKAEHIKEEDSMENEVEKARMILDDDGFDEEDASDVEEDDDLEIIVEDIGDDTDKDIEEE